MSNDADRERRIVVSEFPHPRNAFTWIVVILRTTLAAIVYDQKAFRN